MKTKIFSLQLHITIVFTIGFCLLSILAKTQVTEDVNREVNSTPEKSYINYKANLEKDPHIKDYIDSLENILISCGFLAKDFERNIYRTAFWGDQIWMSENLKSTMYPDGSPINGVYAYDVNENFVKHYGRLYTWDATVNSSKNSKTKLGRIQGICPIGWHVPTNTEWTKLIVFLGGKEIAGGKLKELGVKNWLAPNNTIGTKNKFYALPAGSRSPDGFYSSISKSAYYWANSGYSDRSKCFYTLFYNSTEIHTSHINKSAAFSVRCIKDE